VKTLIFSQLNNIAAMEVTGMRGPFLAALDKFAKLQTSVRDQAMEAEATQDRTDAINTAPRRLRKFVA